MNKIVSLTFGFFLLIIFLSACAQTGVVNDKEKNGNAQIANPASVNCINNGGKLRVADGQNGQYGICTLQDGTECEEWAYYRGECPAKQWECYEQNTECCKGEGENKSCIGADIRCAVGLKEDFKSCDLETCMPNWDCVPDSEDYCNKDDDCACGVNINTRECFAGNKEFVDSSKQCPDFCSGISGTTELKCVDKKCSLISRT